ncbi:hypothetical protein MXE95_03175 [Aeromonas caviae]|uniref:hypothetical protein n=1 Tax=Aeromonas caviae TaxID=648 RepID=UPI002DBB4387|nr:hypothetical protein [Aeromonas caviae]MEB5773116.1 hypothetical protein [Aeromonas caviae]MEB6648339.1 hypothetical protein [Aeromonas caviae]
MEVQNLAGLGIDQARQGTAQKPAFDNKNVNDQLGATLNQGGLLMRMAQSKGQGLAASRGLGNSTIGIDAAQRAMVDAALPIAQQNAQQANSRFMQDDSQAFTAGESAKDRSQQLTMQKNDFSNQTNQAKLNASLTEARDKLLYQQQLGTLSAEGAQRLKELDAQLKNQMTLNNQQNQFTAGQSALDRQQQLTMQGNDYTNQSKLNTQQAQLQQRRDQLLYQQNLGTLDKQGQLELQQLNAQLKNQTTLNNQQFGQQKELNQQQAYLQAERDTLLNKFQQGVLDKEGQQRLKELDTQLKNQMTLNNQQNQWNSAEAQKDRQQQLTVLEKQFGQETSQLAQQVAANTHGMYLSAIDTAMSSYNERYAALMADSTIKTADKTTMLKNMKNELNSTLTMYQKLYSNINTINPDWTKFPTTSLPGVKVS